MGVVVVDGAGRVVALDAAAVRLLGVDGQQVSPGDDWSAVEAAAHGWLVARRETVEGRAGARLSFAHLAALAPPSAPDAPLAATAADADYLDAVLECLDTGVMAFDADMSPVVVNAALRTLHGYPATVRDGHWPGKPQVFQVDGSDLGDEDRLMAMVLARGEVRGVRRGLRNEVTGELRQVSVNARTITARDGSFAGVAMAVHDVSDAVAAERELERQAHLDPLTQAYNRRGLQKEVAAGSAARRRGPDTVLVCDVDRFKALNDTFGHAAGDDVLRHVAHALTAFTAGRGVVARLGGDEFAVVAWDGLPDPQAELVARLEPGRGPGLPPVSVSCGTAVDLTGTATLEALLGRADDLMYAGRIARRDKSA